MAVVCPHCNSKYIHRSKRRGIFELSVLALVPIKPFRCEGVRPAILLACIRDGFCAIAYGDFAVGRCGVETVHSFLV